MALETLRNEITNVESTQIRGLLELFVNLLEQKNEEVITLKNQVQNLEERVLEMEKYSSKDCLIKERCCKACVQKKKASHTEHTNSQER